MSMKSNQSSSDKFKQGAVDLIVKQGDSFKAAPEAINVSSRSLRERHEKLKPQPELCDAASAQDLQAKIKRPVHVSQEC